MGNLLILEGNSFHDERGKYPSMNTLFGYGLCNTFAEAQQL